MHLNPARKLASGCLLGVVVLTGAGCANGSENTKAASASTRLADQAPDANAKTSGGASNAAASESTGGAVDLAIARRPAGNRQIISTAQLELETRNVDQTVHRASALVLGAGGNVFSETASLTRSESAQVVFKVPPAQFDAMVDGLGRLGKLVHRRIGTDDVTGQVVDLGARLAAAQTSAARLRELIAKSASVADLLGVEQQLTTREGEADSLSGQLATLRAQVDLATITLDVGPLPAPHAKHHAAPGFSRGLRTGAKAFASTVRVTGAALGFALPFLGLLMLLGLPTLWVLRRRSATAVPAP